MTPEEPYDVPRPWNWDRFTNTWPANLKIATIVVPVVLIASVIWYVLQPSRYSGPVLVFGVAVTPFYLFMVCRRYRFYREAPAWPATITAVAMSSNDNFPTCEELHYKYEIDEVEYEDSFLIEGNPGWRVGDQAWVLAFRHNPKVSYLWIGPTPGTEDQ
ncbi:MAG: hypothetical protein DWQ31_14700 [Planctomycetota bacterium]|nr:MAG: hypothetical protein DWQ31_14700 [Planctomycetota bacterium]REJ90436.1 MAG: hypothetical protein DWQ35_16330 [Planctomycetota bacterium]REK31614.1 MAG: hypothetical protein DWQ42_00075 [Planctomycetota bacterium]REK48451.1 MAG: hypothetical protein DWQ46_02320 [Planctomycetota bacterium]